MIKKVLIVEDYNDARRFMKILVESHGCIAIEAADGIEAIDKFKQHSPDIVLMDISLPFVDGLTTTKAIRELDGIKRTPIIAITAFGQFFYKEAIEAGCDELINKPVDINTIEAVLNNYLLPVTS